LNFGERRVSQQQAARPHITMWGAGAEPGVVERQSGPFFMSIVIVTINPLAPASIFWNNRFLRSERAPNRLDRKPT